MMTREEAREAVKREREVTAEITGNADEARKRRVRAVAFDNTPRQDEALVQALLSVSYELASIRAILRAEAERGAER